MNWLFMRRPLCWLGSHDWQMMDELKDKDVVMKEFRKCSVCGSRDEVEWKYGSGGELIWKTPDEIIMKAKPMTATEVLQRNADYFDPEKNPRIAEYNRAMSAAQREITKSLYEILTKHGLVAASPVCSDSLEDGKPVQERS